jgi:Family of unknown function (DUF6866) C-terminal domain/Family of unknown function (DUF6866) N-terminal domain
MMLRHPIVLDAVRRNCDIADARHGREATMCTYLLQMRELYCWERGLSVRAQPARTDVSRWIADREAAWQLLENADYVPLPLPSGTCDPFDVAAINQELAADGFVYGAGFGRFRRPHFFLAELERTELRGRLRVFVTGREIARDLGAVPAALQGNTVHVRRDVLRRWLWDSVEFWRSRRTAGALARAIESWGLAVGGEAAFERMVAAETETLILHEVGEARAGEKLGADWDEMLGGLEDRRIEILARAVRDNLADCLSTLPALLERNAHASLHFWFSHLDGMRREIFPALAAVYPIWRDSGCSAPLEEAVRAGATHWEQVARELMTSPTCADARACRL